eukprot:maker-scaffold325_size206031-snap-gene-0.16 protein:Tk11599 transcript:maker-scaffold325_size206031-snap-gene-0.16-mRNA-1 annotation:"PREDICTED: uncharacterized protein LOC100902024"
MVSYLDEVGGFSTTCLTSWSAFSSRARTALSYFDWLAVMAGLASRKPALSFTIQRSTSLVQIVGGMNLAEETVVSAAAALNLASIMLVMMVWRSSMVKGFSAKVNRKSLLDQHVGSNRHKNNLKLQNEKVEMKNFLEKYTKKTIPSSASLTTTMEEESKVMLDKIKEKRIGKSLFLCMDESMDIMGRPICVVFPDLLDGDFLERPYLIDMVNLGTTNNLTVQKCINSALFKLFGGDLDYNKVWMFLTDVFYYCEHYTIVKDYIQSLPDDSRAIKVFKELLEDTELSNDLAMIKANFKGQELTKTMKYDR